VTATVIIILIERYIQSTVFFIDIRINFFLSSADQYYNAIIYSKSGFIVLMQTWIGRFTLQCVSLGLCILIFSLPYFYIVKILLHLPINDAKFVFVLFGFCLAVSPHTYSNRNQLYVVTS